MSFDLYEKARKLGQKAYKNSLSQGKYPYLPVLDNIIDRDSVAGDVSLGLVDIPLDRIVGTSTTGRTKAFASNFMPLMDFNTEFCFKWSQLSDAHLSEGIRDAIKVYEYLNYYYVVEGNKRVSVLKYFEADSIPAFVTRKVPKLTDDPEIRAYYEYMDFYKKTGVNFICFSQEGSYKKLIDLVSNAPEHGGTLQEEESVSEVSSSGGEGADGTGMAIRAESSKIWNEDTLLELKAAYRRFDKAFKNKASHLENVSTGDAFLAFVEVSGFDAVVEMSVEDIQAGITSMWQEFLVINDRYEVEVSLDPPETKKNVISQLISKKPSADRPLNVAFLYSGDPLQSDWLYQHELGRNHIKEVFGDSINTFKVIISSTGDETVDVMEELIEKEGVEVIFTTTASMINASLKCAIKHPEVKILNCSLNTSHRYIRTYEARLYEAKFLSGMIAGSLTKTDRIGYLADYPIFGMTANINAFALGARMVNPNAKVVLKWSTLKDGEDIEDIYKAFYADGIDFVSDQDMIIPKKASRRFGLYQVSDQGIVNMTMATYNWGIMYERIISIIMSGNWGNADAESESRPINYWWGLSAGVVDLILSEKVPAGTKRLVNIIKNQVMEEKVHVFEGEIHSQDGTVRCSDGEETKIDDIITMDWLVDNIEGDIPLRDELNEEAQSIVEMKGVIKESEN